MYEDHNRHFTGKVGTFCLVLEGVCVCVRVQLWFKVQVRVGFRLRVKVRQWVRSWGIEYV